jgi:hypothetical protein
MGAMLPEALKWRQVTLAALKPPQPSALIAIGGTSRVGKVMKYNDIHSTDCVLVANHTPYKKNLILGCGALVYELVELIKHNPVVDKAVELHCLPANLHNTPQLIAGEVDKFLTKFGAQYQHTLVAYGDCGTAGALDIVLEKHNAKRLPGAHCYEFFTGSDAYAAIVEEQLGSFFLTDFLVRFFDRLVIKGLGIDRYPELREVYFKHYTQLVFIAQTENAELQHQAQQHAKTLGLSYHYRFVGLKGLDPVIPKSIFGQIEVQHV